MIAIPHEKWDERPLAVCVLREGQTATPDELREFLAPNFAKFWLPDAFEFVDEIPKTAVGKFRKTALREQFATRTGLLVVQIAGKTFVVTGGLSGLGEATAAMLEAEGATVVIADLPETDVTDEAAVRALIEPLDELHGVVNCAGIGGGARVIGFPLDRFRKVIEVNLIGTFNVLSIAAAKMAEGEPDEEGTRGVIVNTASNAAFDGQIGQAAYSRLEGRRRRDDAADRARPRLEGDPRRHDRARPVGHADARADARRHPREPDVSDPLPEAARPRRGLRRSGKAHHRERVPERRGDPSRRRASHGTPHKGDTMAEYVKVEHDGRVAIVTLDHPPVNALSAQLLEELEEAYDELDRSDETRAIVIRGEGEKAFVAGADITEFPAMREAIEEAAESGSARGIQKLAARMDAGRTPVVAAIHGYCLGGGLELAMACDIRIAAEDAQLGQPEIKLGLIPGGGGTQRLPRLVGHGRALYLNLTGDPISGSQAYDWGLVEKAVPRDGADGRGARARAHAVASARRSRWA